MQLLSLFLFVISSSLDNFIVGLSYGVKKIRIAFLNNFLIAIISGIGTLISMLLGRGLSVCIPKDSTRIIGSLILILLSIYLFYDYLKNRKANKQNCNNSINRDDKTHDSYEEILHHPELADKDKSQNIDYKESLVLGIALSLNNVGLGIGVSIIGLNVLITSTLSALFSLLFIQAGLFIGQKFFSNLLQDYASITSIIIILGLALYSLFI